MYCHNRANRQKNTACYDVIGKEIIMTKITYPYIPEGRTIEYVPSSNPFMRAAREMALTRSNDNSVKTGVVIVKNGEIIGRGANFSEYHSTFTCVRVEKGCKSGEGYDLCAGCAPTNHAEPQAVKNAQAAGHDTTGADAYLWGHWWCCKDCWDAMISGGIEHYYLLEGSEVYFNKQDKEGNKLGRWDEIPN